MHTHAFLRPALPRMHIRACTHATRRPLDRLAIGVVLAFVLGPLMRHVVVPLAASSLGLLGRLLGRLGRRLRRAPVRGDESKKAQAAKSRSGLLGKRA